MSTSVTTAKPTSPAGAAAAPLMYWLLLVSGLAILTVERIDVLPKVVPLWAGAVAGTMLGQFLGARRVRLWLLVFIVANAMWCGAIVTAPLWLSLWSAEGVWGAVELSVLSFAPAALCGYFSLSERGGLPAFWFPAVLWMLALLDGNGSATLEGARGWLLLAVLAALFVAFLHAREARRVTLWKDHALSPLARAASQSTLREAPLRGAAPAAWIAGLGAATLALTAWIAPHLWQKDRLHKQAASTAAASATGGAASGSGERCCPEPAAVEVERSRVRELFPVLSAQDGHTPPPPLTACVACTNGVRAKGEAVTTGSGTTATPGAPAAIAAGGVAATPTPHAAPAVTGGVPVQPVKTPPKPTAPAAVASAPHPPPAPRPLAEGPRPSIPPPTPRPRAVTPAAVPPAHDARIAGARPAAAPLPADDPPIAWLAAAVLAGLLTQLALRPLRRVITLRHLRRPLWAETLDQRVSNLWQLALVGLRDLGVRPVPGEQPQEMARRTGFDGMGTCASVLERVRHGVRVDAGDLEAMERAAEAVYGAARRRAGWAARAAGLLRWPLV